MAKGMDRGTVVPQPPPSLLPTFGFLVLVSLGLGLFVCFWVWFLAFGFGFVWFVCLSGSIQLVTEATGLTLSW